MRNTYLATSCCNHHLAACKWQWKTARGPWMSRELLELGDGKYHADLSKWVTVGTLISKLGILKIWEAPKKMAPTIVLLLVCAAPDSRPKDKKQHRPSQIDITAVKNPVTNIKLQQKCQTEYAWNTSSTEDFGLFSAHSKVQNGYGSWCLVVWIGTAPRISASWVLSNLEHSWIPKCCKMKIHLQNHLNKGISSTNSVTRWST